MITSTKEGPILFSAPMVRAIMRDESPKTQTRRIAKLNAAGRVARGGRNWHPDDPEAVNACPYGAPGDRLWVREKHCLLDRDGWADPSLSQEAVLPGRDGRRNGVAYAADTEHDADSERCRKDLGYRWRPSIHMYRWASRIMLEVVSVRVERVQDITEADALAERLDQETCAAIFERSARGVEMKYGRWLEKDRESIDGDWCVGCVGKAAKKHKAEIDGWDDYPELDGPRWCEKCGSLLTHSLTRYGVEEELYMRNGPDEVQHFAVKGSDAAILANLAGGIGDLRDEHLGRLAKIAFATLWDQLGGKGAWKRNDWVWVVEFRRIKDAATAKEA